MNTVSKQVRVIAVNRREGKPYTKTFKNEPDAWTAYRQCKRSDIMFATIGRVEKFENGTEVFTAWEGWLNLPAGVEIRP